MVAILDPDLLTGGKYCCQCLKEITSASFTLPNDPINATFCSKACQMKADLQWHRVLCSPQPLPTPANPIPRAGAKELKARHDAQTAFVELLKKENNVSSLAVAKLLCRMVAEEEAQILTGSSASPELPDAIGTIKYSFNDHLEPLRLVQIESSATIEKEMGLLKQVFATATEGLGELMTAETYYLNLKGKIAHNQFGVSYGEGRKDRVSSFLHSLFP